MFLFIIYLRIKYPTLNVCKRKLFLCKRRAEEFTLFQIFKVIPKHEYLEVVHVTIGNPAFCLLLYLTGIHIRGEVQHFGDVSEQKTMC